MFERYSGIIDLISFLKEEYGYVYTDYNELIKQPFASYEGTGKTALFWIEDKEKNKYLFKHSDEYETAVIYGELISAELCKILHIPCPEVRVCNFDGKIGILSKKITKENERIITGGSIIQEVLNLYSLKMYGVEGKKAIDDPHFIEEFDIPKYILDLDEKNKQKYLENYLNNLISLWRIIELYIEFKNYPDDKFYEIIRGLIRTFMFDIITMQGDRHIGNWGIIYDEKKKDIISFSPLWDNADMLNLAMDDLNSHMSNFDKEYNTYISSLDNAEAVNQFVNYFYKRRMLLPFSEKDVKNIKRKKRYNNVEVLHHYLKATDYVFEEIFLDYIEVLGNINIEDIICKIEKENGVKLNDQVKEYVVKVWECNLKILKNSFGMGDKKYGK